MFFSHTFFAVGFVVRLMSNIHTCCPISISIPISNSTKILLRTRSSHESLVETVWTFYMFWWVIKLSFHDFIKLSMTLPCIEKGNFTNQVQLYQAVYKMHFKLAAIPSSGVLQVSLESRSKFESS